jgi:hypothetical protein
VNENFHHVRQLIMQELKRLASSLETTGEDLESKRIKSSDMQLGEEKENLEGRLVDLQVQNPWWS